MVEKIAQHSPIHGFTKRRRCQPCKATARSPGAVRVRCLAQGHLDTQLGGAGIELATFQVDLVTSQPTLPPEPHAGPFLRRHKMSP